MGVCCPDEVTQKAGQFISELPAAGSENVGAWEIQEEGSNNDDLKIVNPEDRGCGLATKQFPKITGGRPADPGLAKKLAE